MRLSMDLRIRYRDALLVISNDIKNRKEVCSLLGDTYNVVVASSFKEGRYIMEASKNTISAVLINPSESHEATISFLRYTRDMDSISPVPVLLLLENEDIDGLDVLLKEGAVDCMRPPYERTIIMHRISNAMVLRDENLPFLEEEPLPEGYRPGDLTF